MKINKTISYDISFSIEAHWSEEGGMGHEVFASGILDMLEALNALEYAEVKDSEQNWQIIVNIDKKNIK